MPLLCCRFAAMGGDNEIQVCAEDAALARRACAAAEQEVRRLEAKYSRYRADSVLSAINASAGGAPIGIDPETQALLGYADACFEASDGLFDISSGVLRRAWNFSTTGEAARLPDAQLLEQLLGRVGWKKVEWDAARIRLAAGMEIDFGGICKEYAADRASAVLVAEGVRHGFVNLAGDIRVIGPQALEDTDWKAGQATTTTPWLIGIADPRKAGHTVCTVAMEHGALATSGDYERYIEIDGRRYCHILDPQTGMPVSHWQSVSVIAPLCVAAGSASTIAMLKGAKATEFLAQQGLSFLAVNEHSRIAAGRFAA